MLETMDRPELMAMLRKAELFSSLLDDDLGFVADSVETLSLAAGENLFIQGEMDELCFLRDMRVFYARAAEPKELVVIDGADHVFDGKGREVADAIEDLLGDWRDLGSVRLPRAEPRGRQPDRGSR